MTFINFLKIAVPIVFLLGYIIKQNKIDTKLHQFQSWKVKYNFKYQLNQNQYRQQIFFKNLQKIKLHNSQNFTWKMGINKFSALTHQQFTNLLLNNNLKIQPKVIDINDNIRGPVIDWDSQGMVTYVKDQGLCGASYAFAAVGATESMSAIYFKQLIGLSSAQIVDCSQTFGNNLCDSGMLQNTYDFITLQGIMPQNAYPWTGAFVGCRFSSGTFKKITGYKPISGCNDLAVAAMTQPISVYIDGTNLQFYEGGLFGDCDNQLNASLLLIGLTDNYWKLRNSWGKSWGESGNIRIPRGNMCGVCMSPSAPIPSL